MTKKADTKILFYAVEKEEEWENIQKRFLNLLLK